jgi:hypothetical protein
MKRRRLAARRLVVGCGLAVAAIAVVAALFLLSAG